MRQPLHITILGLSITSSWGNGHATTYRSLARGLVERGHSVHFLERNVPWYAPHRDRLDSSWGTVSLYESLDDLFEMYGEPVRDSDLVIVGSYVPEGVAVGNWVRTIRDGVTMFYDIDTPVTLGKLARGDHEYINPKLIRGYHAYLSFTGGPVPRRIERDYGSPLARPLYCSVDANSYYPQSIPPRYDLGYLGTYSDDRQPPLEGLMLDAARAWSGGRFVVAGPQYPAGIDWPENVQRIEHLAPQAHREFYNSQRFTMNITRAEMVQSGYAPSVRLFEAAACGTPIISDWWRGLDTFFDPETEILISRSAEETCGYLREIHEEQRDRLGTAARRRVLAAHTGQRRAEELEEIFEEAVAVQRMGRRERHPSETAASHQRVS